MEDLLRRETRIVLVFQDLGLVFSIDYWAGIRFDQGKHTGTI